jgi:hypothetical protein
MRARVEEQTVEKRSVLTPQGQDEVNSSDQYWELLSRGICGVNDGAVVVHKIPKVHMSPGGHYQQHECCGQNRYRQRCVG